MNAKIVKAILGVLALVILGFGVAWILRSPRPEPTPLKPTIITITDYEARIDTVYVDSVPREVASMDTLLMSEDKAVSVDLGIRYDEHDNEFDLRSVITHTPVRPKPRLLALTTSLDLGWREFDDAEPERIGVGAGVKILDKYSIQLTADTDKTIGIRLGVDW